MNKIYVIIFLFFLIIASQFSGIKFNVFKSSEKSSPMGIGEGDDYAAWAKWNKDRLADPATGEIPAGIRKAELAFASTLPQIPAKYLESFFP